MLYPAPESVKSENGELGRGDSINGAIRTKDHLFMSIHAHVSDAEAYIVNGPVVARGVQGHSCELACVFTVIDAAKLDTGRAV